MSKKVTRPFVESIHSNLKSPCPAAGSWSVDLGQHTLLVGSNTSHKSSVLQSVELALSGSADDVVGRHDVREPDLLLSLCPQDKRLPGEKQLRSSARMSDGHISVFHIERKEGTNKKANHTGPGSQVLVHRAVKAALSGSVDSRRKSFLAWIGGDVSKDDVFAQIPAHLHGRFQDLFEHIGKDRETTDSLLRISEYAAKQSRDLSRQRKGAEAVIDDMIDEHMESAPSDERIKQLEVAAVEAQRKLEQAAACANGMPEPLRQNKMAQCEEEMNRLGAALNQLEHQSDSTQGNLASVPGYVESGFTSLDWAVRERIEQCPTCSSQVGLDHLVNCHTFFSNTIDAVESANSTAREQLNTFTQERVSLERQYADAERQLLNITNTPSRTDAGITLEDARESLNRVSLALNNTMMLKSKWDQVIAAKQLIHNLNDEVDSYKEIKKSCDKAMSEILSLQSDRFVSVVQSHLPEDWVFQIKLNDKDTGRRTFSMGLVRGGELHEALSGAEWASVTTAVAMAVSEINIPKDKPAVLIPEDRAWDGKTLSSVMRSFRNFNGQVIMASTIRPTGRAPAGWTIIDMDKTSASWLVSEDPLSEDKEEVVVEVGPVEVTEAPQEEVRKDDTIRRPKNTATVTTASAIAIGMMGFSEEDISVMSKNTAADIIRKSLKPGDIEILSGGGYALINGGKVLNLPPAPSR